ncbi:putative defense protein Hdd11-like [Dysidea avara]|uniref:putative defense protein Hdd11-like n=1 Tax=Dysidea avara TaxID=196820 RepID=UPI00331C819A
MNSKSVLSYTILLNSVLWFVDAMRDGAPLEACAEIEPMHPPNSRSNETIRYGPDLSDFPNRIYIPGRGYTIIMGPTTGTTFKGFMIQARRMADNSPVGMFAFDGLNFKAQCTGNTSATHTNPDLKDMVMLPWTAPPAGTGGIYFRYAFVESYAIFWSRFTSQILQEADSPVSSAPSPSMVTTAASTTTMTTATVTTATVTTATMSTSMTTTPTAAISPIPSTANTGGNGGTAGLLASSMLILFLTVFLSVIN